MNDSKKQNHFPLNIFLFVFGICLIISGIYCMSIFDYGGFAAIGLCASELSGVLLLVISVLNIWGKKYPINLLWCSICVLLLLIPTSYYVDSELKEKSHLARELEKKVYTLSEKEAEKTLNNISSQTQDFIIGGNTYIGHKTIDVDEQRYYDEIRPATKANIAYTISVYKDGTATWQMKITYADGRNSYENSSICHYKKRTESKFDKSHTWFELTKDKTDGIDNSKFYIDQNGFLYSSNHGLYEGWDAIEKGDYLCKLKIQ